MKTLVTIFMLLLGHLALAADTSQPLVPQGTIATALGSVHYGEGGSIDGGAAIRIYLQNDSQNLGEYFAILLEYADLLEFKSDSLTPNYIISNKFEELAARIGFLKNISSKASVHKLIAKNNWTYSMEGLEVTVDGGIVADGEPRMELQLWTGARPNYPLEGAHIFYLDPKSGKRYERSPKGVAQKTWFPLLRETMGLKSPRRGVLEASSYVSEFPNTHLLPSLEYWAAKLAYENVGLDSTWKPYQVSGPYLATYNNKKDEVLFISRAGPHLFATFRDPLYGPEEDNYISPQIRETQFTNPKSAGLNGVFHVKEPVTGFFTLSPVSTDDLVDVKTLLNDRPMVVPDDRVTQVMEGRICAYIDIFDASVKLGQDVVELICFNNEDPNDFLMYYEHPDNGDGKGDLH